MASITAELIVERNTVNKLSPETIKRQLSEIHNSPIGKTQCNGVETELKQEEYQEIDEKHFYKATIVLAKKNYRSENAAIKAIEKAKDFIKKSAEHRHWTVRGDAKQVAEMAAIARDRTPINLSFDLTDESIGENFPEIFERNSHIRMIHSTVVDAVQCNFMQRTHTLLYGKPSSAKTSVFLKLKELYEKGGDTEHVAIINSTTLSKAGLESWILQNAQDRTLPEILVFDEIEKVVKNHPDSLTCLLNIMDGQGTISRMNARIGRQSADARCLIWATCNDEEFLRKFQDGAIWSRFGVNRLPCPRPSRDIAKRIILSCIRQRKEMGQDVNVVWADNILEYFYDKKKDTDVRTSIGALVGGKRLETGEYFADLDAIFTRQKEESTMLSLM